MKRFSIGSKYEYCPNGNYWQDISGIFDTRLYLFCDCKHCKGKVYELRPIDVTTKIGKGSIEKVRRWNEVEELRSQINLDNLDEIKKRLTPITNEDNLK